MNDPMTGLSAFAPNSSSGRPVKIKVRSIRRGLTPFKMEGRESMCLTKPSTVRA